MFADPAMETDLTAGLIDFESLYSVNDDELIPSLPNGLHVSYLALATLPNTASKSVIIWLNFKKRAVYCSIYIYNSVALSVPVTVTVR